VVSGPEITAATKVLSQDHLKKVAEDCFETEWHPPMHAPTVKEVAELVLKAAEEKRQSNAKFAAIGQFKLPDGELNHAILAPFSTELQARRAGEGFAHDSKTGTGEGRFMVVKIYANARDAWSAVRPPAQDPAEWIRKSIERARQGIIDVPNTDGLYGPSYFDATEKW